ncbi:MAG TPA: hypothetical protein PKE63_10285 [Lacibacter sp.]|nr:hypothetical protein [Lacibacter sp.]HMO90224.1 hypothetical protein [Lacibacter sp.]HMP87655.1 hypothetical protein [Lacibacter sp.]
MNRTTSDRFTDYLPLFFFICLSGNPLFITGKFQKPILIGFAVLFIAYSLYYITAKAVNRGLGLLLISAGFILLLSMFQRYALGYVSYPGVFALILKIALGMFLLVYYQCIGVNPYHLYIRTLSFLTKVSLPLFALNFVKFFGLPLDVYYTKSQFFYTSFDLPKELLRNSGMFWEPGAFAGYLLVALLLVVVYNQGFTLQRYRKESIWITIGVVSTLSTTGLVVLAFMILFYVNTNYHFGKFLLLPMLAVGGYFAYNNLEVLGEKMEEQYNEAAQMEKTDVSNTRFGALNMDLQYITDQPFTGNGLDKRTRYRFHPWVDDDLGHGNGMSNFLVYWGIPFFLFWMWCVFRFAWRSSGKVSIGLAFVFLLLLTLQGEQFLNYPVFLLFFTAPAIDFHWDDEPLAELTPVPAG